MVQFLMPENCDQRVAWCDWSGGFGPKRCWVEDVWVSLIVRVPGSVLRKFTDWRAGTCVSGLTGTAAVVMAVSSSEQGNSPESKSKEAFLMTSKTLSP